MWTSFAAATGGAAAGLTGLTFIVVAIRFDTLAVSEEYRSRAAQTLSLYVIVTVVGALIAVPQYTWALGTEMLAIALASAAVLISLDATARRGQNTGANPALALALVVFVAGIAASGLLLLAGRPWGMYLYVVSAVVGLVAGVVGAWTFLTRAGLPSTTAAQNA